MACNQLAVSTAQYLSTLTSDQFVATMEQLSKNHPHPNNYVAKPYDSYGTVTASGNIFFEPGRYTRFRHVVNNYPADPDPAKRVETNVSVTHVMPSRWEKKPNADQQALEAEYNQLAKAMGMLAIVAGLKAAGTIAAMKNVKGATVITLNVED